jgi:hypothetical protein
MGTKERNKKLLDRADGLLTGSSQYREALFHGTEFIASEHSSKVSAFPVSVAMIGLKPTLAIYHQNAHSVVGLIAEMLILDDKIDGYQDYQPAERFVNYAFENYSEEFKQAVIENALALKVVIRTFLKTE